MKKLYILLGIAMSITMVQAKVAIDYTVKRGESLSAIAQKYHTTRNEIIHLNGLKKDEPIKMGLRLKIVMNTIVTDTHLRKIKKIDRKSIPSKIKIVKNTHSLKEIKEKYHTKENKLKVAQVNVSVKTHSLKEIRSKHILEKQQVKIAKVCRPKNTHSLKVVKSKNGSNLKYLVRKSTKRTIAKTKKKVKIAKVMKSKRIVGNKKIRTALHKYSTPLTKRNHKRVQQRVTVDDILFKSSKPHVASSRKSNGTKASKIINIAKTKLGQRYVWGATGKGGTFDCSGFTSYVYKKNGISIPRTSRNQAKYGKYIARNHLKKGDLIFFDTSKHRKGYVNHVGIYLGNGKFIHASSAKKKVTISNLSKFYAQRYVGARRPS